MGVEHQPDKYGRPLFVSKPVKQVDHSRGPKNTPGIVHLQDPYLVPSGQDDRFCRANRWRKLQKLDKIHFYPRNVGQMTSKLPIQVDYIYIYIFNTSLKWGDSTTTYVVLFGEFCRSSIDIIGNGRSEPESFFPDPTKMESLRGSESPNHPARWAPTGYKWSYDPFKWSEINEITGLFHPYGLIAIICHYSKYM